MYCNCLRRLLHFQDLHRLAGGGTGVFGVVICADLVAEALADGRAADHDLDLVLQAALVDELDDLAHFLHRGGQQRRAGNHAAVILHGGADELLRRRVYAEVKDLDAAALHHDADEILADVVHVALHGAEAHAADGLGALADHQGLQKLRGGGHAARGHEHFGNERAVGGERLAEAVHADDHALGENVARLVAFVECLLAEGEQLFLLAALERGQQKKLLTLCQQALDEGHEPGDILSKGMIVGMNRLGEAFSANRAFVPEMLMAARCMSAATELLKPLMVGEGTEPVGRVCLGTVKGDMHDIGKNLVRIMMEGSGIEVFDLGVDTSAEQFVSTAVENHCGVIACSSLLTTTMEEMREVVKLVHERGLQDQIKVMVGGAPISQSFCDEIGADYYAEDAGAAAREAVKILKVQKAS